MVTSLPLIINSYSGNGIKIDWLLSTVIVIIFILCLISMSCCFFIWCHFSKKRHEVLMKSIELKSQSTNSPLPSYRLNSIPFAAFAESPKTINDQTNQQNNNINKEQVVMTSDIREIVK